jgi:predicted anti-sigma-YlaC factor YlaD
VNCPEFVEVISAYLDGALEPVHEVLFVGHLRSCGDCTVCLEQFRVTVRVLAEASSLSGPSGPSGPATIAVERREQLVAAFRTARG